MCRRSFISVLEVQSCVAILESCRLVNRIAQSHDKARPHRSTYSTKPRAFDMYTSSILRTHTDSPRRSRPRGACTPTH